jgi:transcriptional regulator with XRE-family HTH domain
MSGNTMTADDFRSIRKALGMSQADLAAHLGYNGAKQTLCVAVSRLERGYRPIPDDVSEKMIALKERAGEATTTSTPPMRALANNTSATGSTQEATE